MILKFFLMPFLSRIEKDRNMEDQERVRAAVRTARTPGQALAGRLDLQEWNRLGDDRCRGHVRAPWSARDRFGSLCTMPFRSAARDGYQPN